MLLDKTRLRTPAGHGEMCILEREDDVSFFVQHIDSRLVVVRGSTGTASATSSDDSETFLIWVSSFETISFP